MTLQGSVYLPAGATLVLLVVCHLSTVVSAQTAAVLPRLSATQKTLLPVLPAEWFTNTVGINVSADSVAGLVQAKPIVNAAYQRCLGAGGNVSSTILPDPVRNAQFKVNLSVPYDGTPWLYYPPAKLPTSGRVPVYILVNTTCSVAGVSAPRVSKGRLTLVVTRDPCWSCLTGCSKVAGLPTTCEVWNSYCPPGWPSESITRVGASWSLTLHFEAPNGTCSDPSFAGNKDNILNTATAFINSMYVAGGTTSTANFGAGLPNTIKVASNVPVCKEAWELNQTFGIAQVMVTTVTKLNGPSLKTLMIDNWHRRNICSNISLPTVEPPAKNASRAFCSTAVPANGRILLSGLCVQGAPALRKYRDGAPIERACFPGDARVTLLDPATGDALRSVTMSDLAIGDLVECLKPEGLKVSRLHRDDEQHYVKGACHVFNYHDVNPDIEAEFVALHYIDEAGRPAKLRATMEHLVYLSAYHLPPSELRASLPPGGFARRADMVAVGDLLAVEAVGPEPDRRRHYLYTAEVTHITRETHRGAFAPLLSDAGLPIVDGAVAFSWVHLPPKDPHPMQNIGEYYRHIRLWMDFYRSLDSGCTGPRCPCLDAPGDASRPCVRLGDRLAGVPRGLSDFAQRTVGVWTRAAAEGRTYWKYEAGIPLGKLWESSRLLQGIQRLLGTKPHTIGILATDFFMVKPPVKPLVKPPVKPLVGAVAAAAAAPRRAAAALDDAGGDGRVAVV